MKPKLNTTRQRGLLVRGARMASLAVALLSFLHGCSNQLGDAGGSETNWWVSSCDDDGDCTVGSCVCGVCSKSCTTSTACPGGGGPTVCAMSESSSYRAVCGLTSAVEGVCLRDCSTTGCSAGFRCEEGACVPATVGASVPEGGSPQTATIETHTFDTHSVGLGDPGTDERLTGICQYGTLSDDLDDESQCTIVEFPDRGIPCDCEAQGLDLPSSDVLAGARRVMAREGYCGGDGGVPCDSLCGCQAPVLTGAELTACRNDDQATLTAGYCVVSPERGLGTSTIVEKCHQGSVVRYFPGERGIRAVMTCSVASTKDVAVASAPKAIGETCTPSDQSRPDFSGYSVMSIVVEKGTPECASNVCLVNYFQGRTDCPYGQPEVPEQAVKRCTASGSNAPVTVPVNAQLMDRPPEAAVYCSCRCDGPGPGPFCPCPTGFACTPLVDGAAPDDVAGSYCVKVGTVVEDPSKVADGKECNPVQAIPRPDGCGDP